MKTNLIASLLLALSPAVYLSLTPAVPADTTTDTTEEGTFKPEAYPLSRYDHLHQKSPFEFEPPKEAAIEREDPFKEVSLAGFVGGGNTLTVYLLTGKEKKRITVYGDGSPYKNTKKGSESGYRIVSLNRGRSLKTTTVTLEKGGETGEVKFDEETLRPKAGAPGQPPMQTVNGPDGKPVQRPIIPRPGGVQPAPVPQYQAPAAYIPGQNNTNVPPPPVQAQANNPVNVGNMNNQQLVQALATQSQPGTPQQGQHPQWQGNQNNNQNNQGGGGGTGRNGQPRRRVVLPTQQ